MKALGSFVFFMFFALISTVCQQVSAQCYVQVMAYCINEQFDNPCSETCLTAGQMCGLIVAPDPIAYYSDVQPAEPEEEGYDTIDEIDDVSGPTFCGEVIECECVAGSGIAYCSPSSQVHSEYRVMARGAVGDECTGEE